jgi:hypothetical protein
MDDRERAIRRKLRDDFPHYAGKCLRIRTKGGAIEPLSLNHAQQHLHDEAQRQIAETGKVRIVVLKGRQQGISTYIEGRAYWKTTHRRGYRTYILTHNAKATDNLLKMARRYHEHCPSLVRPVTASPVNLNFPRLDSDYSIGTAGTEGAGRSETVQFFHGSEVAFWENAASHGAGVLQAVPDEADTEVYFESTACGQGNYFHHVWQQAQAGIGDFWPVFIPWYWQDEYRRDPVELDEEEREYAERHGLTPEQMAWRRHKIIQLGDEALFRQEYPTTPEEAFMSSDDRAFLEADKVQGAMQPSDIEPERVGPKVMGVDVARFGADRTAVCFRQGRVAWGLQSWSKEDTMSTVGRVKVLIDREQPDRVFVDDDGVGGGVTDRLKEMGYSMVVGASAARSALDADRYINKRHEMYGELRDWLDDTPAVLPRDEALKADLLSAIRIKRYDSKGRVQLYGKEEVKAMGVRSPDLSDALALTFYEPVAPVSVELPLPPMSSSWMA